MPCGSGLLGLRWISTKGTGGGAEGKRLGLPGKEYVKCGERARRFWESIIIGRQLDDTYPCEHIREMVKQTTGGAGVIADGRTGHRANV